MVVEIEGVPPSLWYTKFAFGYGIVDTRHAILMRREFPLRHIAKMICKAVNILVKRFKPLSLINVLSSSI
jgi:hypothetical protein